MKNFMIGMYGGFDAVKLQRDFRKGFYGIEACGFPDRNEVDLLFNKAREEGISVGIHYPLLKKMSKYRDPLLFSPDEKERNIAFGEFEAEAAYAAQMGAKYILTHFPKPVLVSRSLDLTFWRFAGEKEWMYEDRYPVDILKEILDEVFTWLEGLAKTYCIEILLEQDAVPVIFSGSDLLIELFRRYNNVKMCLDIGRLHFHEGVDAAFDARLFAERMAPFTRHLHLWDCNPVRSITGHHPVLPGQQPEDGWVDVEAYLDIINSAGKDITILFEHRSDLITDEQLEECYRWVDGLLNRRI